MKWESIYIQEEYENIDSLIMLSGRGKKIQLCIINLLVKPSNFLHEMVCTICNNARNL